MSVLFVHSHYGPIPRAFAGPVGYGRVKIVGEAELTGDLIASARGIITTMHLDQIGFLRHRSVLADFFNREGRLFFNGHILKPFVDGLQTYRPSPSRKLADLELFRLDPHPVFGDLDPADMMTRKGVAGFYGRGHNPLPKGGRALTGIGAQKQPIDWEWALPDGGMMFSHAGNDLWSLAPGGYDAEKALAERIIAWTAGEQEGTTA
jgi:hypothetical protein